MTQMMKSTRLPLLRSFLIAVLLLAGTHAFAHAQIGGCTTGGTGCSTPTDGPEIDPSLASGGAALLAGAVMVIRGSRRK